MASIFEFKRTKRLDLFEQRCQQGNLFWICSNNVANKETYCAMHDPSYVSPGSKKALDFGTAVPALHVPDSYVTNFSPAI